MQYSTTPRGRAASTLGALIVAVVTLAAAASQAWADDRRERIEFDSFTPKNMFELAREHHQNWAPQRIWGDLSLPEQADKPVPAMVLMHGSGGIEPSMKTWVDALNGIGVATFVVSTFEPRGVQRTVEDQSLVPPAANLMDGLQALGRLARTRASIRRVSA